MKITIGIPVYNAEKYLLSAINSILNQTYKNIELIIIDDGSNDNSLDIARSINDSRVKVYSDGLNLKLPARLNQITKFATGDFIARMDADDLCSLNRLEIQINELRSNSSLDAVFTGCCSISDKNTILGISGFNQSYPIPLKQLVKGNTGILHASMLAKKDWCLRNPYNEDNIGAEDFELWLTSRFNNDFNIKIIQEPLYFYRIESNASYLKMKRGYLRQITVLKELSKVQKYSLLTKQITIFYIKIAIINILYKFNKMDLLLSQRYSLENLNQKLLQDLQNQISEQLL